MLRRGGRLFISHSSEDRELASSIRTSLSLLGVPCWMAPEDIPPGSDWAESIMKAIEGASALLLVGTGSSLSSGQVRREIERASTGEVPVFAAVFDGSSFPGWLRFLLSGERMFFFNRNDIPGAALSIMLMLQDSAVPCSGGWRAAAFSAEANSEDVIPCRIQGSPFTGELRSIHVLRLRIGGRTPLWLQTALLTAAERICRGFGAIPVPTALPGTLYIFDSAAPGRARDNAAGCALALQEFLGGEHSGADAGIGLDTIDAISSFGPAFIREIEPAVKRACGLAGESRGKALVTERFKWKSQHLHRFAENHSGGFTITAGPPEAGEPPHPLTGRETELEALLREARALKSLLREADYGGIRHRITVIRGSMGMGKTRLVRGAADAIKDDFTVLTGNPVGCPWLHDSLWGSLLRNAGWETDEMSEACRKFIELYGGETSPAPAIDELPDFRKHLSMALAVAASWNPLVVILEDIDRADSSSIQTFREIIGSRVFKMPVLFIATCEDPPEDLGGRAADSVHSLEITLGPLSREASETVVKHILQGDTAGVAPETMEYLLDMGGGNPFFLEKTIAHGLKTGVLINDDNGVLRLIREPDRMPEVIRASVLGRLYRLSRRTIDIARAASAVGGPFTPTDMDRLFGNHAGGVKVADILAELEGEGFITNLGNSFSAEYVFTREHERRAILATVPHGDRKRIQEDTGRGISPGVP